MAKKPAPKKTAKPVKKAAKPAAKKAVKPAAKKPAKAKPAPKKKAAKPAGKSVKKAPAKAIAKKVAPKKSTAKPVKKAAVKKAAPAKAKATKVVAKKPVAKAPVAKKPAPAKPMAKAPAKAVAPKPTKTAAPKAEKPVKKAVKKKAAKETQKVPSKPLVTQIFKPSRPMQAPIVKKHVSTLESADKLRYADDELEEFKEIIMKKLDEARKDYDLLKQTLANTDNNGTDDTSPSFKMIEDGSETLSREETAQLAARQEKFIKHLEDAQLRIRNKTYGICRVTGRLISKERLRLVPHATLSIEAKQQMNG